MVAVGCDDGRLVVVSATTCVCSRAVRDASVSRAKEGTGLVGDPGIAILKGGEGRLLVAEAETAGICCNVGLLVVVDEALAD